MFIAGFVAQICRLLKWQINVSDVKTLAAFNCSLLEQQLWVGYYMNFENGRLVRI
jgi:hypothetical protein